VSREMEPKMISMKVLSAVAVLALVLPMAAPSVSFAAPPGKGGGPGARGAGAPRGGGAPGPRFSGGGGAWRGGGNYRRGGGGGFIPGAVAGAVIGGAIASQGYGYGYGPGYYDQGYADPSYYDDGSGYVAAGPQGGDDSVAYCMQTYRSYDPRSGTYMGNDGYRHPCP
jgi:hypothetical protein